VGLGPGEVEVAHERLGHAPVNQVDGDGHDPQAGQGDQQLAGRPVEDLVDEGRLLLLGVALLARGDLEGTERQRPRHRGLAQADQLLQGAAAPGAPVAVAPAGLGELPDSQGDQPHGEDPEEEPPCRLLGDRL
jgi:hypothetical protein